LLFRAVYIAAVIRWLRFLATATVVLSMIGLGVVAGLFLVANDNWFPMTTPPRLTAILGDRVHEIWMPALLGGWFASAVLLGALVLTTLFAIWRRRQYESLVDRLERELARLRNLPFEEPAPLEDLPETPSTEAARVMHAIEDEDRDAP
jgi:hypothetical protein